MPTFDEFPHAPWLDSLRRSRARRAAAARRERRSRAARIAAAVVAALSLTAASSAVATSGGVTAGVPQSRQAETVAAIQRALGIAADGIAGPQTRRAIRRFQRAHDLQVDGIAGPQTLAALGLGGATASSASGVDSVLEAIARCESGGDPSAVSADGRYRGKYQFSRATWRAMGGAGDPAAAPEAEQDRRAARLLRRAGTSPWPNCA